MLSLDNLSVASLLLCYYCFYVAGTSPNPGPSEEHRVPGKDYAFFKWFRLALFPRYIGYLLILLEVVACTSRSFGSVAKYNIPSIVCSAEEQKSIYPGGILPTQMAVAVSLIIFGGLIRLACYNALGHLFTFEITFKPSHTLVTSGPYSVVRHPSYTGTILTMVGYTLFLTSTNTVFGECLWRNHPYATPIMVLGNSVMQVVIGSRLMMRTSEEDELLRRNFGAKWDLWAKSTRYRLFPFVF